MKYSWLAKIYTHYPLLRIANFDLYLKIHFKS